MKLTKKLEAEVLKAYKTYWEAYLKGDMKTFASYLADDITVFGTAVSEIFNNKKETLRFYKETADQMVGKAQFRSRSIKMRAVDENILLNEQCDCYVLIEGKWTFYGHTRISSILKQTNSGWKLAHQHASFPDTRADEGEQVATKKIKEENLQLRDAVKRRTIELEEKNRELEIESAVERVRAKALAMHRSEDIQEVVRTLRNELFGLKLDGVTAVSICLKQDDGRIRFWDITDLETSGRYSADITFNLDKTDPRFYLRKIWSSKKKIIAFVQDSNDLKRTVKWLSQYDKKTADEIAELIRVNKIKRGWHRAVKLANGRLITDFINEPPAEIESILLKMGAAFDLAYKRFLDLKNAEAQTREAQIELALERVRARAMAMHNSNELAELVSTVFNELTQLDFKLTSCIIWIHDHENTKNTLWIASSEMNKPAEPFLVNVFHNDFFKSINHAWKSKDTKWIYTFTGKEKKNFEKAFFKELPQLPIPLKNALKVPEQVVFSASFNNFGALEIVETEALTEEKFEILHRFGKVFDSSYTRFNDLQKAEAQAREAQIETGLERVRSKTMAMHKSEEVTGIAVSLNEELLKLGFEGGSTIIIIDKETGDTEQWTGFSEDKTLKSCYVPNFKHPCHDAQLNAWKKGEKFLVYMLTGKEKKTFDEHYFTTGYKDFPESDKKWMRQMASVTFSYAFMKYGAIHWGPDHLTEEQLRILQRFSKVFEQSYTRFLDLQKVETQAREAQVQLALERVRARTMAMQKSDELREAVLVIYQQLQELDFGAQACNIIIIDKDTGDEQFWVSGFTQEIYPESYHVPRLNHRYQDDQFTAWRNGLKYAVFEYTGKEKKKFDKIFFTQTDFRNVPEQAKQFMIGLESVKLSTAFTTYGSLQILGPDPLSEEKADILKRFAKVFEQTYTRFLDLQKAEVQVREAQIEAALERVRSRSMAMHKSDDLHEVIKVVIEQLSLLSVKFNVANFAKIDPDGSWDLWLSTPDQAYPALIHVPYLDHPIFNDITEQVSKKNDFHTNVYNQEETTIFFHHFFENTIAKNTPEERKQFVYSSKGLSRSLFLTKNIWFSVSRYDATPFMEEENAIFKRFANVFEQAYTRFLDLQKAEEQAREADIELSLERVRAKTMAMQKPSEFVDVINIIGEQFVHLGFDIDWANFGANGFAISEGIDIWNFAVIPGTSPISARVFIPYFDHPVFTNSAANINEFLNSGRDLITVTFDKQTKDTWLDHLFTKTIFKDVPEEYRAIQYAKSGYTTSNISVKDTWLSIGKFDSRPFTEEQQSILRRFAKAFGQANTRFLDLQKAEAQAREAQIEAALERVRARAMAMHKSSELKDVARELRTQLGLLGTKELETCAINLYGESSEFIHALAATRIPSSQEEITESDFLFPKKGITIIEEILQAYSSGVEECVILNEGAKSTQWMNVLAKALPDVFAMVAESTGFNKNAEIRVWWTCAFFQDGSLIMITMSPPDDTSRALLKRFALVFGMAYRRFADLKKAEAQAREAQIEASLERVRSRAMAMQNSDELKELIGTVFTELTKLDIVLTRCLIMIYDPRSNDSIWWMANSEAPTEPIGLRIQNHGHPPYLAYLKAWQEKKLNWVYVLEGAVKKDWDDFLFVETELSLLPDFVIAGMKAPERVYLNSSFNSFGNLTLATLEPLSNEHFDILLRFAKVFDLTYTRFNDLQKAEAQTREAQIELALERVRARTMAMHKSEELAETAQVLFQQLSELGGIPDRIAIGIADEVNGVVNFWTTDQQGSHLDHSFSARLNERTTIAKTYLAWKEQKRSLVVDLHGDELKEWIQFAREEMGIAVKDDQIKDRRVHTLAFFSHGWILVTSHEPQSPDTIQILERFASVFNLTYRRFLDLQKAEAQANEARIEIALERIRARALAMHKSDELIEVAKVLWEQMTLLGQRELEASAVHLYEQDPDHIHSWRAVSIGPDANPELTYGHMAIPKNSCELVREWLENFYSLSTEYTIELIGTKQEEWYDLLFKLAPDVANSMRQKDDVHEKRYYRFSKFSGGALLMISKQEPSTEVGYLQKRAAVVFDLAYRRFLDLQKAEAQTREAQIEAALEKVRSRSLAMHKSDELQEVVNTVFERLTELNIEMDSANIAIFKEGEKDFDFWIASHFQKKAISFHIAEAWGFPIIQELINARENKQDFFSRSFSFEEKNDWFNYAFENTDFKNITIERRKYILESKAYALSIAFSKHTGVQINNYSGKLPSEAEIEILKRFSKVFEQAYIRFLDLQKAEAQAKEAQIEASLERVRSKTMAMHNSQDVGETVATMFDQLVKLGVVTNRCGILIFSQTNNTEVWTAKSNQSGEAALIIGHLDVTIHPMLQSVRNAWKNKETFFSYELAGDDIKNYYSIINNYRDYPTRFNLDSLPEKEIHSDFFFPEGAVFAFTSEPIAEEAALIFKRFAGVFGQTYRRYLDLQKAEAQAREALIETGLERVRATTMAMHSSEDVSAATATMFTELEKLGIQNLRGGITIIKPDQTQEVWGITNLPDGRTIRSIGVFDMKLHPFWREIFKAFEKNEDYQYYWLAGKDKEDYIAILNATPNYLAQPIKEFPDVHVQSYFFGDGGVWTNSLQPHSEEDKQVMKRFASVFSLTFRRYQDLKRAEAQAREATIEAALERVRGKAMAMHSSKDLATTIGVFYHELEGLNLTPRRCGVGLINKETKMAEISTMNAAADGQSIELVGVLDMTRHPVLTSVYNNWLSKTEYHPVLRGNEIKEYYQLVRPQVNFPDYPDDTVQYGYFFYFEEGGVYAWTEKELNEEELKIYRRFTSVLSLTYKRYKDLKDAEARTQAAIKDAALDRIRADIASMRTINDLDRITPLIWNELTVLGIPFIRCGVFIMDDEQELIHTFLSTPDGKAIAAFHLPYDTPGNLSQVLTNWKVNKNYIDRWDESEFKQFADILVKQGTLASAEQYLKTIPKGGFYLHFLPFLQGMLYVGNTTQLNNDEIELIQHVADAFSTAYARYEDFNKLEAAKQQVDKTLTDLKQAQTQLVQSEKMASLGELTAGIAHEIQNPLNFVNNFSDVSNELLEEMKIELEKGNKEDAIAIVEDVKQNLEKILHHGKRADAIVKGMLQHSRTSSGQKEPTDVNILADEYLRLAFHGLRAKDKSFNAKFETEFDNSIGKINIIPQDIGRVILNLINNAFYAVTEKKKINTNGYEPVVTVTTKEDSGKIEIKVRDNGNGIPQKVLDKIFQPFFTTKPTGQGTGLGLSLAYDIVTKGHSGELRVETKEGEGSEFIIQLPY